MNEAIIQERINAKKTNDQDDMVFFIRDLDEIEQSIINNEEQQKKE